MKELNQTKQNDELIQSFVQSIITDAEISSDMNVYQAFRGEL